MKVTAEEANKYRTYNVPYLNTELKSIIDELDLQATLVIDDNEYIIALAIKAIIERVKKLEHESGWVK